MSQEPPSQSFLAPAQKKLVGTALALVSFTIILLFLGGVFVVLRSFVATFYNVLWPLAVASILAMLLRPVAILLQRKARFSRVWAIATLYFIVALAVLALLGVLLPYIVTETLRFVDFLPTLLENLRLSFEQTYPAVIQFIEQKFGAEYLNQLKEGLSTLATNILKSWEGALDKAGSILSGAIALTTGLAIIPVYLFFLLESRRNLSKDLRDELYFIRQDWREDLVFLIDQFVGSIVSFFRGQIVIALIMGVLLAIGFFFIGLNFAILLGLAIGLLNIIPYLGSVIGLGVALPIAYFQGEGGLPLLLLCLGVFVAVQMIEGYFLTPRIMGRSTGLHPMVIIIAIFFWGTALDGILGMILAIPLTAFFVVAWRLAKRKFLDRRNVSPSEDPLPPDTEQEAT